MASHSAASSDTAAEADSQTDGSDTDDFELGSEDGSDDLTFDFTGDLTWDSTASTEGADDAAALPLIPRDDYPSLPIDNDKEIRLLQVQPSTDPWTIDCRLFIEKRNGAIEYEALSYTWGSSTLGRCIRVNGKDFLVTDNLYAAICRLQRSESRNLWIDAICINQSDLNEPRCASAEDGSSRSVLDWRQAGVENSDLWKMQDHQLRSFIATIHIAEPKWWDRAWTVQEVVVAKSEPIVAYGPYIMPYQELEGLLQPLLDVSKLSIPLGGLQDSVGVADQVALRPVWTLDEACRTIERFIERLDNIKTLRALRKLGGPSLYEALHFTAGLAAREDQDRVFSLLGMVSQEEAQQVDVDYQVPCADLHMRTMIAAIATRADFYPLMWVVCSESSGRTTELRGNVLPPGNDLRHSWHVDLKRTLSWNRATSSTRTSPIPHRPTFDAYNSWSKENGPRSSVTSGNHPRYVKRTCNAQASLRIHGFMLCKVFAFCYQITDGFASSVRKPFLRREEARRRARLLQHLQSHVPYGTPLDDYDVDLATDLTAVELDKVRAALERLRQVKKPVEHGSHGGDLKANMQDTLIEVIAPLSSDRNRVLEAYHEWDSYSEYTANAFCTDNGHIGLGPKGVKAGDIIVLPDGHTPGALALRPEEGGAFFSVKGFVLMEKDTRLPADTSRWFDLL